MPFDYQGALDAGYSQKEIEEYLNQQSQLSLTKQGVLDVADVAKTSPQIAEKAIQQGVKPVSKAQASSADVKKLEGLGKSGLEAIQEARNIYEKDPNVLTKQLVPGPYKLLSKRFDAALYNAADTVLRLRTGAQANPSEIRGYMTRLAPSFGDDPETAEFKFKQLEKILSDASGFPIPERAKTNGKPIQATKQNVTNYPTPTNTSDALMQLLARGQETIGKTELSPLLFSILGGGIAGPVGAGAGAAVGEYLKQGAQTGGIESLAPTKKNLGYSALKGGEYALLSKVLGGTLSYGKDAVRAKSLNPSKIAGFLREKASEATPTIDTSKIITAGEKAAKLFPNAKEEWDILKTGLQKDMPTKDLLDVLTSWGHRTWTISGQTKDKAAADLMKYIYGAGRESIKKQAPEVAKYTKDLADIKGIPKVLSGAQKISWFLLKLLGIGKIAGL